MVSKTYSVVAPYQCQIKGSDVWQLFQNGRDVQLTTRVNSISVCSQGPKRFCIPSGHKVYLYKCDGDKLYRKLSGYGSRVTCCQFRSDGKLVIVGEENGVVRICTTDKNSYHLRKMTTHKACVNAVSFFADGHHAASAGADACVRIWDVSLGTQTAHFFTGTGKEPVKAMVVSATDPNILYSGSMEGVVALYDIRQPKAVHTLKLPNAISAVTLDTTDKTLVVADGSFIRFWNPTARKFLYPGGVSSGDSSVEQTDAVRIHYKMVTDLCVVNHPDPQQGEVLLSVSLDKLMKVTSLVDFKELHQTRYLVPLTAVAATLDCETMIVGGEKGFVKIRHLIRKSSMLTASAIEALESSRRAGQESEVPGGMEPALQQLAREFSGHWRGGDKYIQMTTDTWLSQPFDGPRRGPRDWLTEGESAGTAARKVPLIYESSEISRDGLYFYADDSERQPFTKVDRLLTRFSHSQALSVVTRFPWSASRRRPSVYARKHKQRLLAVGVIRELARRGTLVAAVAGRDVKQLARLLRFIRHNVWRRESATVCLKLYNCILDEYSADELAQVTEFSKVNVVLQHLSRNTQSVCEIVKFLRDSIKRETTASHTPADNKSVPKKKLRKSSTKRPLTKRDSNAITDNPGATASVSSHSAASVHKQMSSPGLLRPFKRTRPS
ncbi:hypothetical protein CRM22_004922 [Opisthorchis felineus]|uniref:U3 small nucleolar RNA-associated protein 15 homolog n=1 Tax=Opisthorchis felineus TaxID=147828 RepID=A0A4S2M0C9_OPIFE|nr:hypothetical protein CRM22_004922 [Opisthorchis felineus]